MTLAPGEITLRLVDIADWHAKMADVERDPSIAAFHRAVAASLRRHREDMIHGELGDLAEVDRLKTALHQIASYAEQDMFLSLAPAVMMKGIAADALRGEEYKP